MKDYYKILDVDKSATAEEIAAAYRKQALKYHPDRNKEADASDKFKEAAEAFEILSNPEKRKRYDNPSTFSGFSGFSDLHSSPFDIFNTFFGGMGRHQRRNITEQELELTFEEAALGCNKEVTLHVEEPCKKCNGEGVSSWKPCVLCGGSGRQTIRQSPFIMQTACQSCRGVGRLPDVSCDSCGGKGKVGIQDETIIVHVPAGIYPGVRLTIAGKGNYQQGSRGDLIFAVSVSEHPLFSRDGCDIIYDTLVPFATMVLGGEIKIPTLRGEATMKVKPGTQSGAKMRLSGQGIQDLSNKDYIGDMFVVLNIKVPTEPSPQYTELMKQLLQLEG